MVIWLLATPAFQDYPGTLKLLVSRPPAEGLRLLQAPPDVDGLPADAETVIRQFTQTVSSLRSRAAAGQTVAVLDHSDAVFALAAGTAPWWRYSPCFPAIMRRSELAALQRAIVSRGPQSIVVRGNGLHAQLFGEEDVWRAVHQTVESCYRLEDTIGTFEIWRRNER